MAGTRRALRDTRDACGFRFARHADVRAHRGRAEARVELGRRAQGAVRLRGQGRPRARVACGRHRVGGAGVRAAPAAPAVEGLVRRAELPLRATTSGALPPALAGRRRGPRCRGSGRRRRGHRAGARLLPRARAAAVPAARELDGRRCEPRTLPRGPDRVLARPQGSARRRDGARGGESVAHPRLEA